MTRTTRIGTWLLLLALLSATGGSAHDLVLCVTADGHCELERPLQDCCIEVSQPATHDGPTGIDSDSSCCSGCTDVAIVLRAFKRGKSLDLAGDDPRSAATGIDSPEQDVAVSRLGCGNGLAPVSPVNALRTVVLLL